jgi:hypothetical protein
MSARTLGLALGDHDADDLPEGFVIEERSDARQNPAPIVFDLYRSGKRVAWTLRSRDAAIRWAWRLSGVAEVAQVPVPMARRVPTTPWWARAS